MTRYQLRRAVAGLLVVAVVAIAVVVLTGGDDKGYEFKLAMDNAKGLRSGSLITEGGVEIGKLKVDLDEAKGDQVQITGTLDKGLGPIGKDAKAAITSVNLLGQKRLELDLGDVKDPMPDGASLPASRVTESTDLDQVLAVLNPDTRTRLNVLLNEAGAAVVGRHVDIAQLINGLPPTVTKVNEVISQVNSDNGRLAALVQHSDQLVNDLTEERKPIVRLVESAGAAAESAATKREQLKATLRQAPGLLRSLDGFLGDLEQTTVPLGPAARTISATAPEISRTLNELEPFRKAAKPTLAQAVDVAPDLSQLASGATPVLRRLSPTLSRAATFATDLQPVSDTLDKSVDNLIGTIDNWSRAVQYRDGYSHIFRGEPTATQQTVESILLRLGLGQTAKKKGGASKADKPADKPAAKPSKDVDVAGVKVPGLQVPDVKGKVDETVKGVKDTVDKTVKGAKDTVQGVTGGLTGQSSGQQQSSDASGDLLDFLLGS